MRQSWEEYAMTAPDIPPEVATTACPKCGLLVPEKAYVCGHCRKTLRTSPTTMGCGALFGLIVILSIIGKARETGPPAAPSQSGAVEEQGVTTDVGQVDKTIADMKGLGVITGMSRNNNEVRVNRGLWGRPTGNRASVRWSTT
jgi:hypothetical protein